tara:strand:- start:2765 stop:3754 length:990 start_codon:yes stop_codon:yes gene_type:complete
MANNKYAGYSPKGETTVHNEGGPGSGTRLDRVNPYEFKKGMDLELTEMGCSRLAESTPEEREKATETVLKNLKENGGYYSALIQFERGMNHAGPIIEKTFKQYLENYKSDFPGTGMKEVKKAFQFGKMEDADHKNDKMEEPKYDKDVYTLKEAIKNEVNSMLSEVKGKEAEKINKADAEKEVSDEKSASKGVKGKEKALKALDKEIETLNKEKDKNKEKLSVPLKRYKDGKLTADEYRDLSNDIVKRNKEINSRLSDIEKEKDDITLNEKMGRREVAKTMMERDTQMEILNIMKEAGVNLREGSSGIKMYYEIATTAYQEGFMAGLNKN